MLSTNLYAALRTVGPERTHCWRGHTGPHKRIQILVYQLLDLDKKETEPCIITTNVFHPVWLVNPTNPPILHMYSSFLSDTIILCLHDLH